MIHAHGKHIIVKPVELENKKTILIKVREDRVNWEVISVGRKVEEVNKGEIVFISPYGITDLHGEEGLFITTEEHIQAKKDI